MSERREEVEVESKNPLVEELEAPVEQEGRRGVKKGTRARTP